MNVLELFTSQGCSSCPPADVLLQEFSKRGDVLALSFPVSYWDHLGWKDTLAKEAYNRRQYKYAEIRGDREIYTPQLVVNGVTHVIGSRKGAIEGALRETGRMLQQAGVSVSLAYNQGSIQLETGGAPAGSAYRSGKIWVACYSNSVDVAIERGENTGRKITYTNVVRELVPAGKWQGQPTHLTVEIPRGNDFDGVAVLLQADESYAMLGAATLPIHSQ